MELFIQCCNSRYAAQGYALYRSLMCFQSPWKMIWVTCDERLHEAIKTRHVNLEAVRIEEIEKAIPGLSDCRNNRSLSAWFWTLAAQASHYCLDRYKERVTYLDTDLFFWKSPQPLFDEHDYYRADISMFEHKFPPVDGKRHPQYVRALYNVGYNTFECNDRARGACRWWAERVREKCDVEMPAYPEWGIPPGRVGDQPWLEAFPHMAQVRVLQNIGGAIAPYNVMGGTVSDGPMFNGHPLLFYHFHEFRADEDTGKTVRRTGYHLSEEVIEHIYLPYEKAVEEAARELWG